MAPAPAHDLDVVRKAINDLLLDKPDAATHDELQRLLDKYCTTAADLKDASMKSPRAMGLRQACIDIILARELHMPYAHLPVTPAPAYDLDVVRKAINDLRPDKPDAIMHFIDTKLQRVLDEGYTNVYNLKVASMKSMRAAAGLH